MSISSLIKSNPGLKKVVGWAIISPNRYRPRLWVRIFVNPFKHKYGKGSVVRWRTKMDLFPYRQFELGKRSVIEDFSTVNNGVGDVIIDENSFIGVANVIIGPVSIGKYVMTAQNVVISGMNHSYEDITIPPFIQKVSTAQIRIEDNVWIGANAVITSGISIGKHAVVGAGSIVTKDILPYTVVAGNPAKAIKKYNSETETWEKI